MIKRFNNFVLENFVNIPDILYHATYAPLLEKIKIEGLDTTKSSQNWEDSVPGYVYLAKDPDVAISYAETSDNVDEDWLEQIILLEINTKMIDKNKFYLDNNVINNEGDTIEYRGVIPPSAINFEI